jgi:hypothetical protein
MLIQVSKHSCETSWPGLSLPADVCGMRAKEPRWAALAHGDSSRRGRAAAAGLVALSAGTCPSHGGALGAVERVAMIHFTLAHGMVSARSR